MANEKTAYDLLISSLYGKMFWKGSNGSPFRKDTILIYNNLCDARLGQDWPFISVSRTLIPGGEEVTRVDLTTSLPQSSLRDLVSISVGKAKKMIPDLETKLSEEINRQNSVISHTKSNVPKLDYSQLKLPQGLNLEIK